MSRLAMGTKRFERSGHPTLAYDDLGPRDTPPVVMLPGGSQSRRSWRDIPQRLADTYRVLPLDMRGHGESDWAGRDYRIEHYASDVEAFVEQVAGGRAALVGSSWGGLVAAHVAGTRPELVSHAFFIDVPLLWERHPAEAAAAAGRRFDRRAFEDRLRSLMDDRATTPELWAAVHEEALETGGIFPARKVLCHLHQDRGAGLEEIAEIARQEPLPTGGTMGDLFSPGVARTAVAGLLACDPRIFSVPEGMAAYDPQRPITCPMHLLRADPASGWAGFPAEDEEPLLAIHPKATVELVPDASHGMAAQMPDVVADKLRAFLGGDDA